MELEESKNIIRNKKILLKQLKKDLKKKLICGKYRKQRKIDKIRKIDFKSFTGKLVRELTVNINSTGRIKKKRKCHIWWYS